MNNLGNWLTFRNPFNLTKLGIMPCIWTDEWRIGLTLAYCLATSGLLHCLIISTLIRNQCDIKYTKLMKYYMSTTTYYYLWDWSFCMDPHHNLLRDVGRKTYHSYVYMTAISTFEYWMSIDSKLCEILFLYLDSTEYAWPFYNAVYLLQFLHYITFWSSPFEH